MQPSNKTISRLWLITLFVVLLLLATIDLVVQARSQPEVRVAALVSKHSFLRQGPQGVARILAVLGQGTAVTIIDSVPQGSTIWYQIKVGMLASWLPFSAVTLRE